MPRVPHAVHVRRSGSRFAVPRLTYRVWRLAVGRSAVGGGRSMVGPKGQENAAQALAWVAPPNGDRPIRGVREGFCKATK